MKIQLELLVKICVTPFICRYYSKQATNPTGPRLVSRHLAQILSSSSMLNHAIVVDLAGYSYKVHSII